MLTILQSIRHMHAHYYFFHPNDHNNIETILCVLLSFDYF